MNISKNKAIKHLRFVGIEEYVLTALDLKLKTVVDITKWSDYDKRKALTNKIKDIGKKQRAIICSS